MLMGIFTLKRPRKELFEYESALNPAYESAAGAEEGASTLVPEVIFKKVLSLERRRSERSGRRFVLMLVHTNGYLAEGDGDGMLLGITRALALTTRETDLQGWYKQGQVVGTICTEIGSGSMTAILNTLHTKVTSAMRHNLNLEQMNMLQISFHVFPDDGDLDSSGPADARLYPDIREESTAVKIAGMVKRGIDIVGSACALLVLSPLMILIATVIKLTSEGPILFRQQRVGKYGTRFTFLKFRSMYFKNDTKIHQEFVRKLIAKKDDTKQGAGGAGVYKIKNDPRVTAVGRFLRKTSLDELPQFLNVLIGDMSLVGPRPPIPYEVEAYDIWHRRRFLETKPGITGLWQVEGRSRTKFDEMVRLDLKYARTWSPWLDIKILLRTPGAVFKGDGAY
jgi:exopolysaccharide biosynthesis polyprenyl glycosylphosphotransferase